MYSLREVSSCRRPQCAQLKLQSPDRGVIAGARSLETGEPTLYSFDRNGNITWQTPDTAAKLSWSGDFYLGQSAFVSKLELPRIALGGSFWPVFEANESGTRIALIRETLLVRSFAPWQWFGPEPLPPCTNDCFRGDDRTFSTNTSGVTSRITGIVRFALPGTVLIDAKAFSDPSHDVWGRTATAHPTITAKSSEDGKLHIHYAGANPLAPPAISPDIDTKLEFSGQLGPTQACYSGQLTGDAFPNSEVFVINSQKQATMMLTFATSYDRNIGPTELIGNNNKDMGSFQAKCTNK